MRPAARRRRAVSVDARAERLLRVVQQIQNHLLELRAVAAHRRHRPELELADDSRGLERVATRPHDVRDQLVDVGRSATLDPAPPSQRQQVLHDRRRPQRFVVNRLEGGSVLERPSPAKEQLRESHYRGERVVQLVRRSGEHRAERRHALAATHQFVLAAALGHVVGEDLDAIFTVVILCGADRETHDDETPVAALPTRFHPLGTRCVGGRSNRRELVAVDEHVAGQIESDGGFGVPVAEHSGRSVAR